jgi:CheY-like chemotaxis protein
VPPTPALTGVRVLVVDDDEATRYIWSKDLGSAEAIVTTAADGQHALLALRDASTDVIVVDLVLPDMDGFEFLKGARKQSATVPAIAFTAFDEDGRRDHALRSGFAAYFVKPVAPSTLIQEIVRLMRPR